MNAHVLHFTLTLGIAIAPATNAPLAPEIQNHFDICLLLLLLLLLHQVSND